MGKIGRHKISTKLGCVLRGPRVNREGVFIHSKRHKQVEESLVEKTALNFEVSVARSSMAVPQKLYNGHTN